MLAPCWVAVHSLMNATGHAVRDVSALVSQCQLTDQLCAQFTPKYRFLLPIFQSLHHSRHTHRCSCVASCVRRVLCMRCQLLRCADDGGMGCVYVGSVAFTGPAAHGLYLPVRQSRCCGGGGGANSKGVAGIVVWVQPCG